MSELLHPSDDPSDYEQYLYDPNGNRTSLRKRDGSVLGYWYDALNRMTAKIVPERSGLTAAQTRDVYYDYDLSGLQTEARFDHIAGEGITTAYDGFGRVSASTLAMAGTSRTIGHLYDGDGNRIRITHPDGAFFPYDYDGLGRFLRVGENGPDTLVAFSYDAAGHRSGLVSGGMSSAFTHDPAGRPVSLAHDLAGTGGDQVIGLGYNPASQIVSRTGSNDVFAWTGAVAVDRPYSVNGQNQYTSAGPATFAYDPNGNLTSDGSSGFVYDVENRLVSASGAKTAALVYDPLGRLFQTSGGAAGVTRFLYDDDALIGEYDASGYMVHRYIHGSAKGVDDPLIWYHNTASGWRRPLIADQQGSIIAVADMHGNPIVLNTYDEYGIPGAGNQGRFQYTGQAWIPELGMYYYKARFYSPTLGRFLQTDPVGHQGGINLYAYVDNDPVNKADPTGNNPYCTNGYSCDPEVQQRTHSLNDTYREAVDADSWGAAWESLKNGDYGGALGNTFKGAMAVIGLSPAGRSTKVVAVIGHYAKQGNKVTGYVGLAQKLGARFFEMPMPVWNKMTPVERWAANTRFLDRQIRDGAVFRLSHRAQDAKPGSAFAREVKYLKDKGYQISDNGYTMAKEACNSAATRLC